MQRDYTKICRVCMAEGSRDIFPRNLTDPTALGMVAGDGRNASTAGIASTSPLDRLLEKLRYVTMMKIDESDDLPRLLCDLCIVQLNVAYNFKRQAVENDTKLRQYFIENGISSSQYNAPVVIPGGASMRSSFAATPLPTHQHPAPRHIPIIPFIVKSEAAEIDGFSDVTEPNLEIMSNDNGDNQLNLSNNTNSSISQSGNLQNNFGTSSEGGTSSSMVYLINGCNASSVTPSSEVEFVPNPRNSIVSKTNLKENRKSSRTTSCSSIRRQISNGPSKNSDNCSNSRDENLSQSKKQKVQHSSIDLDVKEQLLQPYEIKRLVIDSKFQPSNAPRQARLKTPLPGRTHRIAGTHPEKPTDKGGDIPSKLSDNSNPKAGNNSEKKTRPKRDGSQQKGIQSGKITSTPHKSIDSRKLLLNPFTPKLSASDKLLKKIKTMRGKRPPEKIFRPKINPPTARKTKATKLTPTK